MARKRKTSQVGIVNFYLTPAALSASAEAFAASERRDDIFIYPSTATCGAMHSS
jgi:hypothetical protein